MYIRLFISTFSLAALLAGCTGSKHPPSLCNAVCECEGCSRAEEARCTQDESIAEQQCITEYSKYQHCKLDTAQCVDGHYITDACLQEMKALVDCRSSGCAFTGDGVCDEPDGTGFCPPGTDVVDCQSPSCPYVNDGTCDEPDVCAPGTDVDDCQSFDCLYANDGKCDEPQICPPGTDVVDCQSSSCSYANDGTCDEPNGTGLCPEGTDGDDCNHCDSQGFCGNPNSGCIACALGGNCWDEFNACSNNLDCDGYTDCVNNCAQGNQSCFNSCAAAHPTGATLYDDLAFCVICQECTISCNGANSGC